MKNVGHKKKNQSLAVRRPALSLRGIADVVFRRKWLILLTVLTAGAATAIFAWMTPDKFESRMKLLVRNMRPEATLTAGSETVSDNNKVSPAEITSEIELLKSRDILEQIVNEQKLAKPEIPGTPITEKDTERAIFQLEKDLDISLVKKSNIIEIGYTSGSPEEAADVLRRLSELYFDKHLKLHRPPGAYEFFKAQTDQYGKDLVSAENSLSDFQQNRNVVVLDQQKELTLGRLVEARAKLKDLTGTIAETDKKIATLENQLKGMEARITTQSRVMPNQYSAERLNTMLVELRNKRIEMLAKFHPNDRLVREVEDQIKETSEALDKATASTSVERSSDVNPLRQALEGELSNARVEQSGRVALHKNLVEQVAGYEAKLKSLEDATPVYGKLNREVQQSEENYQLYSKKQEESRIGEALDEQKISNVSVAEEPNVPRTPNNKNRILTIFLGLGLGLVICVGGVFVSELARDTFLSPGELEAFTDFPVLATIPLHRDSEVKSDYPPNPGNFSNTAQEKNGDVDEVLEAFLAQYKKD